MSTYDYFQKFIDRIDAGDRPIRHRNSGYFNGNPIKTVQQAADYCHEHDLDPAVVSVHSGVVQWKSATTEDEAAASRASWVEQQKKHLLAIAQMHAEYMDRGLLTTAEADIKAQP